MDWRNSAEVINAAAERRGIPIAELARRVDMTPDALYSACKGERNFKADEILPLMVELELEISDFKARDENDG